MTHQCITPRSLLSAHRSQYRTSNPAPQQLQSDLQQWRTRWWAQLSRRQPWGTLRWPQQQSRWTLLRRWCTSSITGLGGIFCMAYDVPFTSWAPPTPVSFCSSTHSSHLVQPKQSLVHNCTSPTTAAHDTSAGLFHAGSISNAAHSSAAFSVSSGDGSAHCHTSGLQLHELTRPDQC